MKNVKNRHARKWRYLSRAAKRDALRNGVYVNTLTIHTDVLIIIEKRMCMMLYVLINLCRLNYELIEWY